LSAAQWNQLDLRRNLWAAGPAHSSPHATPGAGAAQWLAMSFQPFRFYRSGLIWANALNKSIITVLHFTCKSVMCSEFIFPWEIKLRSRSNRMVYSYPIAPLPCVENKTIFPPLNCFWNYIKIQSGIFVWGFFWVINSVPLITVSSPLPIVQNFLMHFYANSNHLCINYTNFSI
jgi:hypothetical protein